MVIAVKRALHFLTPLFALALVEFIKEGITDMNALMVATRTIPGQEEDARKSIQLCLDRYIPPLKAAGVF